MSLSSYRFVMFDLETDCLDPSKGHILEIGALVFDIQTLQEHSSFEAQVKSPGYHLFLGDFVRNMHTTSGLLADVEEHGRPLLDVERDLVSWLRKQDIGDKQIVLCGNSIHFDRAWVDAHLSPVFQGLLSHRMIDVRTLMFAAESWLSWTRRDLVVQHRAMADCRMSLETLRELRALLTGTAGWVGDVRK